jgi:hypothetical protein
MFGSERQVLRKAISSLLPESLVRFRRDVRMRAWRKRAFRALSDNEPIQQKAHGLPGELVVSLTSYPARFGTLPLTIASLRRQSVPADRIVLWLTEADSELVTADVGALAAEGLEIRTCDELMSFKKLIPALEAFPDAFIATADDDLYFPPDWLETLTAGEGGDRSIRAWRTHRLKVGPAGIAPYMRWHLDVQDQKARSPSADLLPTSGSGALFPPGSLDPRVTDRSLFQRLCPTGDDLWFFWCARMAGTPVRKVGGKLRLVTWPGSQEQSLWADNKEGGNDRMIRALTAEFGLESLGLGGKG